MKVYFQLIRIKHWLKNILIFLPLIFSKNLLHLNSLLTTIIGFLAFSLIASIVYINNDINDIEKDKKHIEKKKRPIASGKISIKKATIVEILLGIISIVLLVMLYINVQNIFILILPIIYLILNS